MQFLYNYSCFDKLLLISLSFYLFTIKITILLENIIFLCYLTIYYHTSFTYLEKLLLTITFQNLELFFPYYIFSLKYSLICTSNITNPFLAIFINLLVFTTSNNSQCIYSTSNSQCLNITSNTNCLDTKTNSQHIHIKTNRNCFRGTRNSQINNTNPQHPEIITNRHCSNNTMNWQHINNTPNLKCLDTAPFTIFISLLYDDELIKSLFQVLICLLTQYLLFNLTSLNMKRKIFHIFIFIYFYHINETKLLFGRFLIFFLLFLSTHTKIINKLKGFLVHKDMNKYIFSHIYLLAGCVFPCYFLSSKEYRMCLMALCIHDALATIPGQLVKSKSKTIMGAFFGALFCGIMHKWCTGEFRWDFYGYIGMVEYLTLQNDNIIIPFMTVIYFKAMKYV